MNREKKFIWYGLNKFFNSIEHSQSMTTDDLLKGNYPSWFSLNNRKLDGNCDFLAECFFTGLKDKNGKDIYEGDVCEITLKKYEHQFNDKKEIVGSVQFSKIFVQDDYLYEYEAFNINGNSISYYKELEVIGNIYQNPELLHVSV